MLPAPCDGVSYDAPPLAPPRAARLDGVVVDDGELPALALVGPAGGRTASRRVERLILGRGLAVLGRLGHVRLQLVRRIDRGAARARAAGEGLLHGLVNLTIVLRRGKRGVERVLRRGKWQRTAQRISQHLLADGRRARRRPARRVPRLVLRLNVLQGGTAVGDTARLLRRQVLCPPHPAVREGVALAGDARDRHHHQRSTRHRSARRADRGGAVQHKARQSHDGREHRGRRRN
mmetsp:Transcript_4764/g.11825  ORF Transcript_4764/g.11825 Transcript_4764/m.11825 type:complete len:234 (+) Transcript_4764:216-917(+)